MPTLEICLLALLPESPKKRPIRIAQVMWMPSLRYVKVCKKIYEINLVKNTTVLLDMLPSPGRIANDSDRSATKVAYIPLEDTCTAWALWMIRFSGFQSSARGSEPAPATGTRWIWPPEIRLAFLNPRPALIVGHIAIEYLWHFPPRHPCDPHSHHLRTQELK